MDHRGEYGKPDAGKLACPVWSRGKAVRPYLLLPIEGKVRVGYASALLLLK